MQFAPGRYTARVLLAVSFLAASLVFGATAPTPTATPTVPPTPTLTATPSVLPTATLTPTLEPSPTSTASPTVGLPPTPTAAPTTPAYTPPPAGLPASHLPQTVPGLSRNEGTFLITAADDGSRAVYFIAGNARHSILGADLQLEMQLNPLWPVRQASRDEVLSIVEGAPVGSARAGLLSGPAPETDAIVETPATTQPIAQPATDIADAQPIAQPVAAAAEAQPTTDAAAAEQPIAETVASDPVSDAAAAPEATTEAPAAQATSEMPEAGTFDDAPVAQTTYVMQPGDNLTRVAERYHTSVKAILDANRITNANLVFIGKTLVIPGTSAVAAGASEPAPVAADASETAPVAAEAPATVADTPQEATMTYTVRRGDSAIGIARQFGVDVDALLSANGVADRNRVYVGQVLVIPAASS